MGRRLNTLEMTPHYPVLRVANAMPKRSIGGLLDRGMVWNGNEFLPPPKGAALYLPGYPGQGSVIKDYSGGANHGAITGATWGRLPSGLYYLDYDMSDDETLITDAVSIQNIFDGGGGAFSWIKPDSDGQSDIGTIMRKGGAAAGWIIRVSSEVAGWVKLSFFQFFNTTIGNWDSTSAVIPIAKWSFVAVSYNADAVGNDPTFYIGTGGTFSTLTAGSGITEASTPVGTRISDVGQNMLIGNSVVGGTNRFDGGLILHGLLPETPAVVSMQSLYQQTRHLFGV